MKKLFTTLIVNIAKYGTLKKASMYDESFASVEYERNGKIYKISVSCEDVKENNNGNL